MLDKFRAICTLRPELAQVGPIIDQARDSFHQECAQHGLTAAGKYLRVSDLARELGLDDEYRAMGSFLSKLIHPTGLSICHPSSADFSNQYLLSVAAWYFNDSYERLNEILKNLKLPPLE